MQAWNLNGAAATAAFADAQDRAQVVSRKPRVVPPGNRVVDVPGNRLVSSHLSISLAGSFTMPESLASKYTLYVDDSANIV
jgi:hypothetical protein